MNLLYKLIGIIIGGILEGAFSSKPKTPEAPKEDDAETKWRKWRIARDEELEEKRKNKDKGQ